jgi:hypothetical protein
MSHRHTHQFMAFTCAVLMTLTIFSGVISLGSTEHGGPWLVQAAAEPTARV